MTITISDLTRYKSPDGAYDGYFLKNHQPHDWILHNSVFIKASEWFWITLINCNMKMSEAYEQTQEFYQKKYPNMIIDFEPAALTEENVDLFIANELENDINGYLESQDYNDWENLIDLLSSLNEYNLFPLDESKRDETLCNAGLTNYEELLKTRPKHWMNN